jgi:hypothetical protein
MNSVKKFSEKIFRERRKTNPIRPGHSRDVSLQIKIFAPEDTEYRRSLYGAGQA